MLYADGRHKLLVILQGVDACGKDGTIRSVFEGVNPQGVKVASFKRPTDEELGHDYLWRIHAHLPRSGEIAIFNRSHYEDVLIVRVHDLVPRDGGPSATTTSDRSRQMLVDEGTHHRQVLPAHIEGRATGTAARAHRQPGQALEVLPRRSGRAQTVDEYATAFEDMLTKTSTADSPWYVIPADRNWYRNLVVSQVLVDTLEVSSCAIPRQKKTSPTS